MFINKNWPYAWAVAIALWSFLVTHEIAAESRWGSLAVYFVCPWGLLFGYLALLNKSLLRAIHWSQLGHLIVFVIAAFVGFTDSHLQCVMQIVYMLVLAGVILIWVVATIIFAIARILSPIKFE